MEPAPPAKASAEPTLGSTMLDVVASAVAPVPPVSQGHNALQISM